MPTETKPVDEVAELIRALPPHLCESFAKANADIADRYNLNPGMAALMRMWIACARPERIRWEFECAVLEITRKTIDPPVSGIFDEDCL